MRRIGLELSALILAGIAAMPASATTAVIIEKDFFATSFSTSYHFQTNSGNGNTTGQTGFAGTKNSSITFTSATQRFTITPTVPPVGSTLNSVRLNLSRVVGSHADSAFATGGSLMPGGSAGTGGTGPFVPIFASVPSTFFIQFSAPLGPTTVVNAASLSSFDLLAAGYGAALAAGNTFTIDWATSDTFSIANLASYAGGRKGQRQDWTITRDHDIEVEARISIDYTEPIVVTSAPEPGAFVLVGLGLVGLGFKRLL
jgi:hypothetical protein